MEKRVEAPDDVLSKLVPLTTVNRTRFTDLTLEQRKQEIFNHITASMISVLVAASSLETQREFIKLAELMAKVVQSEMPDRQICPESSDYALELLERLIAMAD